MTKIAQDMDLETLQIAREQARTTLKQQLSRFSLSVLTTKSDPGGQAFWNDPLAAEAALIYRQLCNRLYRLTHLERCRQNEKDWQKRNQDRAREYNTTWYRANRGRFAEYNANWHRANPDKVREIRQRRRALLAGAVGSYTVEEFRALCEEYKDECAYCGKPSSEVGPLVPDHMTPLNRGGTNDIDNIIPACRHCNSIKGDKTVEEFLEWLERMAKHEKA